MCSFLGNAVKFDPGPAVIAPEWVQLITNAQSSRFRASCDRRRAFLGCAFSGSLLSFLLFYHFVDIKKLSFMVWRILLRVPWTARRSNQSILKEINTEYSLEGQVLKVKHQYFAHLMQRVDSLEKTLMLGKTEARGKGDDRG